MGCELRATCLECHTSFSVYDGGAVFSHAVRCEECGETKFIGLHELGDLHARFVKGLPGAYSSFTRRDDAFVQEHVPVEPISQTEYNTGIEAAAGRCACGGKFSLTAPPRCPGCRSTNIRTGDCIMFYD
jgi:hypothetical protein